MQYPKINSLFKRDMQNEGKLIVDDYSCPEFEYIKKWRVQEKIDGMNIRICFNFNQENGHTSEIKGRNENSMLPKELITFFSEFITPDRIRLIKDYLNAKGKVVLFGEGYGPKIQSSGNYRDNIGFILFDVWGGSRWSSREEVKTLAERLLLPVPYDYGIMSQEEIIDFVKSKPQSNTAVRPMQIEGVICRTEPLMRSNSSGDPIMFKLKCRDFK